MKNLIALLPILFCLHAAAQKPNTKPSVAKCNYDGKAYPVGTTLQVNGKMCQCKDLTEHDASKGNKMVGPVKFDWVEVAPQPQPAGGATKKSGPGTGN